MRIVSHFGVHWTDEGVAFLEQGRSGANAVGLRMKSPFQVKLASKRRHCNHQVALNAPVPSDFHWDYFTQLANDDLVRAMMPIPKLDAGIYWLEQTERLDLILTQLARMTAPIHPIVIPMWMMKSADNVIDELHSTNIQPLCLTSVEAKHSGVLADICRAAPLLPRRLILSGSPDVIVPQQAKRISTCLNDSEVFSPETFSTLPWEQVGATVVRKFMRRELNLSSRGNGNGTSKDTPRVPAR